MVATHDTEIILDGRYRLERRIGVGGMATVYRAWDEVLHRHVAVKMLHPSRAADPTFVERFKREACATANLAHPDIVAVYTWGASDDTYYIVMEYVDGPNLKQVVRERGPLPETDALTIAAQIADALDAAHARGIVHRDITPQNILIASNSRVKVTDFGIAHAVGDTHLTTAHTVLGTAHYLSPEQVLHRPVDGRADLYSLGVVLYELVTARPPFSGDSVASVALQHAYVEAPSPRVHRPDLSTSTGSVIEKALAKNPDARYQTAGEMRAAISRAGARAARQADATMPLPLAVPPGVPVAPASPPRASTSGLGARRWLLLLPVLALLLLMIAAYRPFGPSHAAFSDIRAASSTATLAPTRAAAAVVTAPPAPTAAAPPAPTVTPPPTATPLPPTPTAPPHTATAPPAPTAPRVIVQASTPAAAVLGFYQFVATHQFDRATALWTPRLQTTASPAQAIDARYAQIDHITVEHWEVTQQTADHATVAIAVAEYNRGAATPQRFEGTWQLVHIDTGWLLDAQQMQPA
jgi:serine/threonine-protein kinase